MREKVIIPVINEAFAVWRFAIAALLVFAELKNFHYW
jgi:hypothetical protein